MSTLNAMIDSDLPETLEDRAIALLRDHAPHAFFQLMNAVEQDLFNDPDFQHDVSELPVLDSIYANGRGLESLDTMLLMTELTLDEMDSVAFLYDNPSEYPDERQHFALLAQERAAMESFVAEMPVN